ncbi:hypothetical protein CCAX7_54160 [Capsulimonas corticalis]|uniref:Uncharacterized protein n=1 Tax=Capsulimonas corticalis TaxID=2219043 RepID=A0A402CN77_9BACT|nr:hypothetical protein [Capsulimonas corticalis]BDI33365.1 hypothetical protein CCAX7_54160 [Capsulimonas corticalis]
MPNYTPLPDAHDVMAADRAAVLNAMPIASDPFPMPTVQEVLRTYRFAAYEWRTFQTFDRRALSWSMSVTHPADPTSHFIVMFEAVSGEWTVQYPSRRSHHGPVIIEAARRKYSQQAN